MQYRDLRDWIERVRDLGELRDVREASCQEDIGRATETPTVDPALRLPA